jgi:hypothetical protein
MQKAGASGGEDFPNLPPTRYEQADPIVADLPEEKISGASRKTNELPTRSTGSRNRCASTSRRRLDLEARQNPSDLVLRHTRVAFTTSNVMSLDVNTYSTGNRVSA